jgi:N-acetylmuramoyl-L-alanine amidase
MKRRVKKVIEIRKPNPPLKFRSKLTPLKKVDMIILHHIAHKTADIHAVHNYHRSRTYINSSGKTGYWSGIGYNYFITFDGIIYEARGLNVGAHTLNYNNRSIGIGFQGDFQQQQMPDAQLKAGAALCKKLMQDHSLTERDIKLHKDLSATVCPGKNFRISELKELLLTTVQNPPPTESIIYTVQVGAFLVKSNAELLMHNLIKQGYSDVFIRDNC